MKYSIGIDLGGTEIKYGLVAEDGTLLFESKRKTEADKGADVVANNIMEAVQEAIDYGKSHQSSPIAIGVGTPGIVDKTNRIVLGGADNIVGWSNIHLSDLLEARFNLPTAINNDANLMGLGEQAYGAAKDCSDVMFITVGTGIGGAIIINNQLFGGYANCGTELGHIPLIHDGIPCSCGSVGCLEAYASTTALIEQFSELCLKNQQSFEEPINGRLIVQLYHQQHPQAIAALQKHWDYLGRGIAGLVNIFSSQKVVIGGGISEAGDFYLVELDKAFRKYVMPDCATNTELCLAKLGNRAGLLGAARFVFSLIQQ